MDKYDLLFTAMDVDEVLMNHFYQQASVASPKIAIYTDDAVRIISRLYTNSILNDVVLECDGRWIAQVG